MPQRHDRSSLARSLLGDALPFVLLGPFAGMAVAWALNLVASTPFGPGLLVGLVTGVVVLLNPLALVLGYGFGALPALASGIAAALTARHTRTVPLVYLAAMLSGLLTTLALAWIAELPDEAFALLSAAAVISALIMTRLSRRQGRRRPLRVLGEETADHSSA